MRYSMIKGTNAPIKPQFEGQVVKYKSPHSNAILFDIAKINAKYGYLEWWAINEPTQEQIKIAEKVAA
jgi:hypothetical protein